MLSKKIDQDIEKNKDVLNEGGKKSDFIKLKEGKNLLQILVEPQFMAESFGLGIVYPGCGYRGNSKYLTWALDYTDNKIKLWKLPETIARMIGDLENSERSSFTTYEPMPYRLEVMAIGAGTKEVKYSVHAGADKALSPEQMAELKSKDSILEVIKTWQENQKKRVDSGEVKIPNAQQEMGYSESLAELHEDAPVGEPILDMGEDGEMNSKIPF